MPERLRPPFQPPPAAAALLLVALACSGCGGSESAVLANAGPPQELQLRATELLPDQGAARRLERALWLEGRAWLDLEAEGRGGAAVRVRFEGAEPQELVRVRAADSEELHGAWLELPGDGPRALEVVLEAEEGLRWTRVELVQEAPPPPPPAGDLAGCLEGRDVVVIVPDSLHADHLSSYGYGRDTSPRIDAMAARGVRFEQAYSQTSWTLSSVSSLFTSVEQERHGVLELKQQLDQEFSTLAELFSAKGYRTHGLIQNGVIWKQTALDQGFDWYGSFTADDEGFRQIMEQARELLLTPNDRPLFVYIHLTPPHQPYHAPEELRDRYVDPEYAGEVDGSLRSCGLIDQAGPPPTDPDVEQLRALYDAHIRFVDAEIGSLLQDVMEGGRKKDLLAILTSDHGEAFLQHGRQGHNAHVYEEMVHVPLVMLAPGSLLPGGATVRTPVSLLDVMPTLVDLCALEPPRQRMRGSSLAGLLAEPTARIERPLFYSSRYHKDETTASRYGVRVGTLKLELDEDHGVTRLFDLASDPAESVDLAAERPLATAALRGLLEEWRAQAQAERARAGSAELDEEVLRQLEHLGYAEPRAQEREDETGDEPPPR